MSRRTLLASGAVFDEGMDAASDERLLKLARAGDERAFQALIERYRPRLVRHCASIVGETGAQDAVQQASINVWLALRRGCEVQSLRPWLFAIARSAAWQLHAQQAPTHELPALLADDRTAEEHFELSTRARATLAAVAALPPAERDALVQSSLHGRSGRELAGALGLSETATRQLIFRARARARDALGAWTPAFAFLAPLGSHAQAGLRRVLSLARHGVIATRGLEAGHPASMLAPLFVSGVLVAAPIAATEHGHHHPLRTHAERTSPIHPRVLSSAALGRGGVSAARAEHSPPARRPRSQQSRQIFPAEALASGAGGERAGLPGDASGPSAPAPARAPAASAGDGAAAMPQPRKLSSTILQSARTKAHVIPPRGGSEAPAIVQDVVKAVGEEAVRSATADVAGGGVGAPGYAEAVASDVSEGLRALPTILQSARP